MGSLATADTDPDPPGAHQAGFFLFLKAPGGIRVGRGHDIDVITCVERHAVIAHYGGAFHQQVVARLHGDAVAGKQGTCFTGRTVFLYGVSRFLAKEPFFGLCLFPVVVITFRRRGQVHIAACRHADIPAGGHLRRFGVDVASGDDGGVAGAGDFGPLLAHGFIDNGFLFRV